MGRDVRNPGAGAGRFLHAHVTRRRLLLAGSALGVSALTAESAEAHEDGPEMFIGQVARPSSTQADCLAHGTADHVAVSVAAGGSVVVDRSGAAGSLAAYGPGATFAAAPATGTVESAERAGSLAAAQVIPCVLGTKPPRR